ncbi:MAG: DUF5134 domain-containing protein [Pseudonocardiaceae bacterium]
MSMPLLPQWLRVVWALALAGVVLVHVSHAWFLPGQGRWWHTGHIIMALGMIGMYLLGMTHPGLSWAGVALFGVLTLALATTAVVCGRREAALNPLWVVSAVDMLAMTYMLLPPATRPTVVNWVFVAYLACQVLAWALGLWDQVPALQPAPAALGSVPVTTPATERVHSAPPATVIPAHSGDRVLGLTAHCTPAIRVSLAVMAASMAYMLAVR